MKAISIRPEYAAMIYAGFKRVEVRSWKVDAPCDLLMCTSKRRFKYFPGGYAVAVIHVECVTKLTEAMLDDACMDEMPEKPMYAWVLSACWGIEPFPVKGKLHIYDVEPPKGEVEFLPDGVQVTYDALKPLTPAMPSLEECLEAPDWSPLFI